MDEIESYTGTMTRVCEYAFAGRQNLRNVSLPNAVTIGDNAFASMGITDTNETIISLPVAETIGSYAFRGTAGLRHITLPAATSVGNNCFQGAAQLVDATLSVAKTISGYSFAQCTQLKTVNAPQVETVQGYAFQNTGVFTTFNGSPIHLMGNAFQNCTKLAVLDLTRCTDIGNYACGYCYALEEAIMPAIVTLATSAFQSCTALKKADIGPNCTTINTYAFSYCQNLDTVIIRGSTLPQLGTNAFGNTKIAAGTGYIYFADAAVKAQAETATNWAVYAAQFKDLSELPA
jgi:hypothetical protein